MKREKLMLRWLVTPEAELKMQKKAEKAKMLKELEQSKAGKRKGKEKVKEVLEKVDKGKEPEEYTEAELMKK
eukprot:10140387-Heterocapsa_arctica.AAC.1